MNLFNSIDYLLENADTPIRYRLLREFVKDERAAKNIEPELLENAVIKLWLKNLKPEMPPQHWSMEHGSFDFCLENALLKAVRLGLHIRLPQFLDAVQYYINRLETIAYTKPYRRNTLGIAENFLILSGYENDVIKTFMTGSLDEMYEFVRKNNYDIYINAEERNSLKAVPEFWKNKKFIKRDLVNNFGYCYPLIYDIVGLHKLYALKNPETDKKIDAIIKYISTDEFHNTVSDGYGILTSGDKKYHSMGWDPKYPGWFDIAEYIEKDNVPKLFFFAEYISKYPLARETKWLSDLFNYLEKYRTDDDRYLFPSGWLKEQRGYAVMGSHISFGENRKKKNWREIESTFYMLLLSQWRF